MEAPPTALLTDHYELTMLRAALADGTAHRDCVFEVFARHLPEGRRYGVLAGTGRVLDAIGHFRFDAESVCRLQAMGVVDEPTAQVLADWRFGGDVDGYAEGEVYFPDSPVLSVRAPFAEAVLLETVVLSILNHDSAIASAASRMVTAAGDRPLIEMGGRRTHEEAAVAAARAAYLAGFAATSNLMAGLRHGVPTSGTSAHAFTLLHDDERSAFAGQVAALGAGTTLLVDTFDSLDGVRRAVEVAGPGLGAVRLDSGDLASLARETRALLDELGAQRTRIVVTSDLDEWAIASLSDAPVDGFGVGTSVVTGSGHPTAGFVYKLVARERAGRLEAVAKSSSGKRGVGGRKWGVRGHGDDGVAVREQVHVADIAPVTGPRDRLLTRPLVRAGEVLERPSLDDVREHAATARSALPAEAHRLSRGGPVLDTELVRGAGGGAR